MTEAHEIDEIMADMEAAHADCPPALHWYTSAENLRAIIADWRAKKEEIERLGDELRSAQWAKSKLIEMRDERDSAAEAIRAKCEAIARDKAGYTGSRLQINIALSIADAIAALAAPQSSDLTTS